MTDQPISAEVSATDRGDGVGLRHSSAETSGGGDTSPTGPIPTETRFADATACRGQTLGTRTHHTGREG